MPRFFRIHMRGLSPNDDLIVCEKHKNQMVRREVVLNCGGHLQTSPSGEGHCEKCSQVYEINSSTRAVHAEAV